MPIASTDEPNYRVIQPPAFTLASADYHSMPNLWRKPWQSGEISRILSDLRPDSGAGSSLVVQTGFPTSLADLVVKNRGRWTKTMKRRKKHPVTDLDSSSRGPAAEAVASPMETSPGADGAYVSLAARATEYGFSASLCPAKRKNKELGIAFVLLLVMTLVMLVLAIERAKLVAGIMISTFSLWLLDSIGFQLLGMKTPRVDAKRRLNSVVGVWNLQGREVVSPIREIGMDRCSHREKSEGSSLELLAQEKEALSESERRYNLGLGKDFAEHDMGPAGNSKARKLFGKMVTKLPAGRGNKAGKALSLDSSGRADFTGITEIEEEEKEESTGVDAVISTRDVLRINPSHKFTDHVKDDAGFSQQNGNGIKSRSCQQLVFCIIVLLGLLGGKSVAFVLTIFCFLFHKSIKSLWKQGKHLVI